ncbi:MAG: single-stranded DNA-binding protein [Candidatus Marinimicrobia bacterium]|jgi:single-strand DNA-binding protein|nr:single-stranded DNA-binding protein [Candidatus Neomarinimicrobiota bacterium]MBT3631208.1 single-stranded DNA-binding protein [Candidatus Neomarinimicrobiota bacterium]MBT3824716.1 single-stranded DNA-binding protein [Candidatus Neomarinimicrobiota bacterium]MBT4131640.1 single-stranded DNA-binding protein [Candidatus Neomarinimicrobiota bacterium]MBT4296109.1 single-stranded DNA-binding protein [Candidatus Neomarinimicrobiota bacterium]
MQKNSVNKAILVGRLGQKPELKYTASQMAVVNLSVATTESRKDREGNYKDETEWTRVVVFGKTAEFVANYLDKGALVYVEGRLQTRSWENKDGVKMYTTEVIANAVTSLGSGGGSQGGGRSQSGGSYGGGGGAPSGGSAPSGTPFGGEDDEPLPF